jgi:hypothetical protein
MHFNTKYINLGDSEKEIKDKTNYNFNQILSFAIGHEGLIGPKGATGIPGPSGRIGATGNAGDRASEWFRGTTFPSQTPQEFDLWIDDSSSLGDVYERDSSSWLYTGFSLFNSDFFDVYSGIVGPLGLTDKSAIGLNPSYTPDQTSLVISDTYFSSADVNPNNSKLLISTSDQVDTPIFSFVKSNSSLSQYPSFYWKNTGLLSDFLFKTPGKLSIGSLLDLEISSDDSILGGDLILNGDSFYSTTQGNLNLTTDWPQISLFTDFTINSVLINSLNFGVDTSKLYTKTLTEISSTSGVTGGGSYVLSSTPSGSSINKYFGGISIDSSSASSRVFDFTGISGGSILYGVPSGSVSSGNHKQVVFGETGGVSAGSTGGPYSYHVKRLNNIFTTSATIPVVPYSLRNSTSYFPFPLSSVLDIAQSSKWNSNMIVATLYSSGYPIQNPYLYIPSTKEFSLEPVFYSGPAEGNEYRVYLNDTIGTKKIKGIVYTYYRRGPLFVGGPIVSSTRPVYINFPSPCSYVDLFWAANGSSTNPNGRIFWKTCDGSGGILEMTNEYAIQSNSAPPISSR